MVVFGQKWLYSCKSGCIPTNFVLFGQSGSIRQKWLYSCKVILFKQDGCIEAKLLVFGKKVLSSGKVVVFGQKWLY